MQYHCLGISWIILIPVSFEARGSALPLSPSIMSSRSMPSISWVKTSTSWVKLEIKLRISSDQAYVHANPSGFERYSILVYCPSVHQCNQRSSPQLFLWTADPFEWSSVLWNPELLVNSPSTSINIYHGRNYTSKIQTTQGSSRGFHYEPATLEYPILGSLHMGGWCWSFQTPPHSMERTIQAAVPMLARPRASTFPSKDWHRRELLQKQADSQHLGVSINGGTQNRWFTTENTIKTIEMDDLGVVSRNPHFLNQNRERTALDNDSSSSQHGFEDLHPRIFQHSLLLWSRILPKVRQTWGGNGGKPQQYLFDSAKNQDQPCLPWLLWSPSILGQTRSKANLAIHLANGCKL